MALDIQKAIAIWRTDDGYRTINSFLIDSTSRKNYTYHKDTKKTIEYEDKIYNTADVVDVIKHHMKEGDDMMNIYYRGGSERSKNSFVKKSFISVSSDEEQAQGFVDGDCCLFKVTVQPEVKRYKTGIEDETLLENGLYWNYLGKKGNYHLVEITKNQEKKTDEKKDNEQKNIKNNFDLDLESWREIYKDECSLFDEEPTTEGFVEFINKNTKVKGGKKKKKHTKKKKIKRNRARSFHIKSTLSNRR